MRTAVALLIVVMTACGTSGAPTPAPTPAVTSAPATSVHDSVALTTTTCGGRGALQRSEAPFGPVGAREASVYLPACYEKDQTRRFPVVFLLHGAGADSSQWPAIGLAQAADDLIARGQIPPMIVVMPDGGTTMPDNLVNDLLDRLVPWADRTYRTEADPAGRAVGGISRGGRVALLAVADHPGFFAGVGGHSPAVGAHDAAIASRLTREAGPVRLDVGSADSLRSGVEQFAAEIVRVGGSADMVEAPGRHDRVYWATHVPEYLRFYASVLT